MSKAERRDALECRMLKRLREELVDAGRWVQGSLFHGSLTAEQQRWDGEDWIWRNAEWEDLEFGTNADTIWIGRLMVDPTTPAEALESLMTDDEEAQVRNVEVDSKTVQVCLVGGVYMVAGMEGVENAVSTELIQVMVATGRACQQVARARQAQQRLTDSQIEEVLPYDESGMDHAESIIIGFNDDPLTDAEDIAEVIRLADIELACIRQEVPA